MKRIIISTWLVCFLSGCSVLPYHENFSCSLEENNLGQCISPEEAYQQALRDNEFAGNFIQEDGSTKNKEIEKKAADSKASTLPTYSNRRYPTYSNNHYPVTEPKEKVNLTQPEIPPYKKYRERVYEQMAKMLNEPNAPLIKPAKAVRTLVMNYQNKNNTKRMYNPRYIYEILEEPSFLMTQYRLKPSSLDQVGSIGSVE